jgi:hypothetical protein
LAPITNVQFEFSDVDRRESKQGKLKHPSTSSVPITSTAPEFGR